MRRLPIGPKLIALLLAVGLVPLAVIALIANASASGSLREAAGNRAGQAAFNAVDKLDRNLFERYGDVQAFAQSDPAKSMDPARLRTWMDAMMATYTPIYRVMVVADRSGRIVAANTVDLEGKPLRTAPLLGRDVSGEAWFRTTAAGRLEAGETLVEDLHRDELMQAVHGDGPNAYAMSFSYPIRDDAGRIVGVWSNRFNWDVATGILDAELARAKAQGQAAARFKLLNRAGIVLGGGSRDEVLRRDLSGHPVVRRALAPNAQGAEIAKGPDGADDVMGWYRSRGFGLYPGIGWSLLASQPTSEALADSAALTRTILLVALLGGLAVGLGAWWLGRRIAARLRGVASALGAVAVGDVGHTLEVRSADELGAMERAYLDMQDYLTDLSVAAQRVADGDLSSEIAPRSEADVLGTAFAHMTGSLRELTGELRATATSLTSASQAMASTSEETGRAVGEIAAAVGEVAQGAERQVRTVEVAQGITADMAASTRASVETAEATARAAREARSLAEVGAGSVTQATQAMEAVRSASAEATRAIRDLGEKSEQIGGIVDSITAIARQTNLLALNAAIEAARAGEQGRGFAVVAEEVRKLAEESQAAAGTISALVEQIQTQTARAVQVVEAGAQRTEEGAETVEDARSAFVEIGGSVRDMADRVEEIALALTDLAGASERMQEGMGEVVTVAETSSAASEEVSASTEQTSASTQEIAASAQQLAANAEQLERLVGRFRLAERA